MMGRGESGLFSGTEGSNETKLPSIEATFFLPGKLEAHQKHLEKFIDVHTLEEYEAKARKFFASKATKGVEWFYDVDGVLYKYSRITNEFGICGSDGMMITYFMPEDHLKYWHRQVQKYGT